MWTIMLSPRLTFVSQRRESIRVTWKIGFVIAQEAIRICGGKRVAL